MKAITLLLGIAATGFCTWIFSADTGAYQTRECIVSYTGSDWLYEHTDISASLTNEKGEYTTKPMFMCVKNSGDHSCFVGGDAPKFEVKPRKQEIVPLSGYYPRSEIKAIFRFWVAASQGSREWMSQSWKSETFTDPDPDWSGYYSMEQKVSLAGKLLSVTLKEGECYEKHPSHSSYLDIGSFNLDLSTITSKCEVTFTPRQTNRNTGDVDPGYRSPTWCIDIGAHRLMFPTEAAARSALAAINAVIFSQRPGVNNQTTTPGESPKLTTVSPSSPASTQRLDRQTIAGCTSNFVSNMAAPVEKQMALFANKVDYYDHGTVSAASIQQDLESDSKTWPRREYQMKSTPVIEFEDEHTATSSFQMSYQLYGKRGVSTGTLDMALKYKLVDNDPKITSVKSKVVRANKAK